MASVCISNFLIQRKVFDVSLFHEDVHKSGFTMMQPSNNRYIPHQGRVFGDSAEKLVIECGVWDGGFEDVKVFGFERRNYWLSDRLRIFFLNVDFHTLPVDVLSIRVVLLVFVKDDLNLLGRYVRSLIGDRS